MRDIFELEMDGIFQSGVVDEFNLIAESIYFNIYN